MKKPLLKIKVSLLWIPYLFFLFYFEVFQMVWVVFMMLLIHEIGHIVMGYYLQIALYELSIYPFGIFADYENLDQYPSYYESLMAISGVGFQIINFVILNILYQYDIVSLNQVDYYQTLNIQMAFFNLLPIYPLDGGRMLRSFCMHFLPYCFASKITYVVSIVCFVVILRISSLWIFIFIGLYIFYLIKEFQQLLEKKLLFYFGRFSKCRNLPNKIHASNDLYKDYHNIIVSNSKRLREKQWVSLFFVRKS